MRRPRGSSPRPIPRRSSSGWEAGFEGDVHLIGGPKTVRAFHSIGALDQLGIVKLPLLVGGGVPFSSSGIEMQRLGLESDRSFPDGAVELLYTFE